MGVRVQNPTPYRFNAASNSQQLQHQTRRRPLPTDPLVFPRTGVTARNRTVLAAMTNRQSLPDGTLSQAEHDWLVMRAARGFGIVTTACAHVSQDGQGFDGEIGIWNDQHIQGLSCLSRNLRANGALSFAQIFHAGMRAPQRLTGVQPVSPSAAPTEASVTGYSREATEHDIQRLVSDFSAAARRVVAAGFDGLELHGAHGYIICQFLSAESNLRKDAWGGSIQNRSRFLFEVLEAVKRVVPEKFLVGVRISPEYSGIKLEESMWLVSQLTKAGVDFIHLSCWDSFKRSSAHPHDPRTLTQWFTSAIPALPPIITAGKVWNHDHAVSVLSQGADMVAVARSAIGNPDWADRIGDPNYQPFYPPYTPEHLRKCGLSDIFIHYMRNWKDFVTR